MWHNRSTKISYAICLGGLAVLVFAQRLVPGPVGGSLTALLYVGTVLLAGSFGGWKSGLATSILGVLAATFFFKTAYYERIGTDRGALLQLAAYFVLGIILSSVCELLQRAWRRIEERQRELEMEVIERRKAEAAEQARADELLTTLESIGDGVIRTDQAGRITYMNPVAEELVGWKTQEVAGRMLSDVFQVVNEMTRLPAENPLIRAMSGRRGAAAHHSLLMTRAGTERPIDDSAAPIRDATGRIVGCVFVFRDLSERQRSQIALRESERRNRAIGESIEYGVWICDAQGRNTYASESFLQLVGLTQDECSEFGWTSILHPEDQETTVAAWHDCIRLGSRWDREYRVRGVDGRWHHILARGVPVRDEQDRISAWVGINLDISRLKSVEAELRDADRRKDEFLATLAHELRNPLATISYSLQILKKPLVDAETIALTNDMMERQVQHLVRLVDDLLDVSRVTHGKIELRLERVELAKVVARAVETAQPLIDARGHRMEISVPEPPLFLHADPVRLAQVISNVLTNAVKYTDRNGQIRLTARQHGQQAEIVVRDNGIGIAPHLLPHVFDLFVQADHSASKSQGGLGIGLTLVKNLLELHGGSIGVHSDGLGHGAAFTIHLPLAAEHPAQPIAAFPAYPQAPPSSGLRLLVVDDNEDAARSLAMLLRFQGHDVQIACNGTAALGLAPVFSPDMALLDLGMPEMDGYEVARRLRMIPSLENIFLVALTGWGQREDRRRTAEAGFDEHLIKPPEPMILEELLTKLKRRNLGIQA